MAYLDPQDVVNRLYNMLPGDWYPDLADAPDLNALLSMIGAVYSNDSDGLYQFLQYVQKQSRIATATDFWLDLAAQDYFGHIIQRHLNESDNSFRKRIMLNLLAPRATRCALTCNLQNLTGFVPEVIELRNTGDCGSYTSLANPTWGGCAYNEVGHYGTMIMPYQLLVNAYRPLGQGIPNVNGYSMAGGGYATYPRPFGFIGGVRPGNYGNGEYVELSQITGFVTDQDIYDCISRTMSAGTIAWTSIADTAGEETANAGDMLDTNFYLDLSLLAAEDLPVGLGALGSLFMNITAKGQIMFGNVGLMKMVLSAVGNVVQGSAPTGTGVLTLPLTVVGHGVINPNVPIKIFISAIGSAIQNTQSLLGTTFVLGDSDIGRLGLANSGVITGIQSIGALSAPTVSHATQPKPQGIQSAILTGQITTSGDGSRTVDINGIQSTTGIGSFGIRVDDSIALTGISSTSGVTAPTIVTGQLVVIPAISTGNLSLNDLSITPLGSPALVVGSGAGDPSLFALGVQISTNPTLPSVVSTTGITAPTTSDIPEPTLIGISSTSGVGTLTLTPEYLLILGNNLGTITGPPTNVSITGISSTSGITAPYLGANLVGVQSTTGITAPTISFGIISNIHIGLPAWSNTTYSLGNRISNSGNAYQCITAGTSTVAPTGTSLNSSPGGTAHWKWLSTIDYTTLAAWEASIPSVLTKPIFGNLWNDGPITTTAGTAYLTLTGHTTSTTNTITLQAAPGESFRDTLAGGGTALAFNTANGVAFTMPNTAGNAWYFDIADTNVIFKGLQFQDPDATSNSQTIISQSGTVVTLIDCIFDGYAQAAVAIISIDQLNMINCLVIDRQASGSGFETVHLWSASNSKFVNCTFVSTASGGVGQAINADDGVGMTGVYARNCIFMGYAPTFVSTSGFTVGVDHCVFSDTSVGTGATDNGNNLFSKTATNQFVNVATDFRIKTTADAYHTGVLDTTDIPTADDIVGQARGSIWDMGCFQV